MENKERYWLRGGIVGIIYFIVTFLFAIIIDNGNGENWFAFIANFPGALISHFVIRPIISMLFNYNNIFSYISVMISNFLIGALIGWIYGKIKNRKK